MVPAFPGPKQTIWFRFFRKNRVVHDMIATAVDIEENLNWGMEHEVSLKISTKSSPSGFQAMIAGVDHSPTQGYVLLRAVRPAEALAALRGQGSFVAEYESKRGIRYLFESLPLSGPDPVSGELKVRYPSIIESAQDLATARFRERSSGPIQIDVEKHRGVVIDLGLQGLRFTSNRVFEKGTLLKDLKIDLPRLGPVQGTALVKHLQPSTEYPLWRYLCGVEFTEMKPRDQRKLNRYVNRMLKRG